MADTMLAMDYRLVDVLNSDQLEAGDLIGLSDEIVEIIDIETTKSGFVLTILNEYGEKDIVEINDGEQFELFVYQ
jgi:hypothetical protein